jgi:hypothetical protein
MWYDDLPANGSWASLWHDLIVCGNCGGIRDFKQVCPGCGAPVPTSEIRTFTLPDGTVEHVTMAFMGAEGRYQDYVYLQMMEREWERPLLPADASLINLSNPPPSPRAAIVLLFWTYFETRIDRLLRLGLKDQPAEIVEDLLNRYASVGARMDRLYKIVFGTTYFADLNDSGFQDITNHLVNVQKHRNDFSHGQPEAIDDELVRSVVEKLKAEHEAWVSIFNKKCRATLP